MGFRVLHDYPRRAHLEFYRRHPQPFYGLSFDLDATRLRARAKEAGASTYAALCWAFHRALLGIEAFRVRLAEDEVVLHDRLRIGLTVPAPGGAYSFATPAWHDDAPTFLRGAAETMARASRGVDLTGGDGPDFAYYTALPKVPFTGFVHVPLSDPGAGQPNTAFGRFGERDGRLWVPVGLTVNHRYVHGADLGALFEAAQESFAAAF